MGNDQLIVTVNQLIELRQKRSDLQSAWLRQLLTMASAALALLAALAPRVPAGMDSLGKYLLACTWVFLGVGIISGSAASYLQVSSANNQVSEFQSRVRRYLEEGTPPSADGLVVGNPHKIFEKSKTIMVLSLLLAVFCLVSFSVLATLSM